MKVGEHTIKAFQLPKRNANILDLGCRGFEFANHFKDKHNVYSVDIDTLDGEYFQLAISDKDGWCGIEQTKDPQATHIKEGNEIKMMTLKSFSDFVNVNHWDLIKMDIEGEEMKVLRSSRHPIANQISVEFHAHTGKQTRKEIDDLLDWLKRFYWIENRDWEERHCCSANYWDILLIAK